MEAYHHERAAVLQTSEQLQALNIQIARVKEGALAGNLATLRSELIRLKATQSRHSEPNISRCADYLEEKAAKEATEQAREVAREALRQYSENIYPQYEQAINRYLERFNSDFRLDSVSARNTRGGTVCSYSVLINNVPVDVMANTGPSFKTTLSAGDRNTLALAFFFASLDANPRLAQMTVVIDDPMTSLDEHRSMATAREILRLADRVEQLIVLSHSKPFLCGLWESSSSSDKTALSINRDGDGSTLASWDVNRDCITEHDRRHQLIQDYIRASSSATERETAVALRPTLEAFCRVAYPEAFRPGDLIGPFISICRQRITAGNPLLSQDDTDELDELRDYGNRFHHDSNSQYLSVRINDHELLGYCRRTIAFTRRTMSPVGTAP